VISVQRLDPHSAEFGATLAESLAESPPGPADLASSPLVQSDAAEVRALADQLQSPSNDAWTTATSIERFVFEQLTKKDFSTAFASAAEVARTRQGDCTEHAVLTAALCRARGIPARMLFGLVYVSSPASFAFHMWNEVWIDGAWVPIDATLGRAGVPPTHLIMGRSSLDGHNGIAALLPILEGMGELEIEIKQIEYQ
jgi:transglutaminase-like putative cysteine protease